MENNVGQGSPLCIVAWLGHATRASRSGRPAAVADVIAATVYRFVMVHRSEEQSVWNVRLSLTEAGR